MKKLLLVLALALPAAAQAPQPAAQPQAGGVARQDSGVLRHAAATSTSFTTAVANDLLFQLADGMESRNPRLTLAAFDPGKFAGYSRFSDQVSAWLREHAGFRVYYKLRQAAVEGERGIALVDFAYETQPFNPGAAPVRRHEQLRFTFERGAHGWKIVDVSPRSFFS